MAIVQGIYAKHYGLSLTTLATVVLMSRFFDALSDPIIGFYADHYRKKTGTRKPLIFFGGLLLVVSSYFLYVPSPEVVSAIYFGGCLMGFYLAWTLFEIPHIAWAGEFSLTSKSKTKVYSFRNFTNYLGLLMFYAIPLLPIFNSHEITPYTLQVSVVTANILLIVLLTVCLKATPSGEKSQILSATQDSSINIFIANKKKIDRPAKFKFSISLLLKSLIINRPFMLFMGAYVFSGIGVGMWYGLIFIYVDGYLGLGEQFAEMFLFAFIVGILATPLWYKLAVTLGNRVAWFLAMVLVIISLIWTGFLDPDGTTFGELVTLKIIQTLGFTCMGIIAPSMLAEIADYSTWKFGTENSATYFSIYTFVTKTNNALAAALGLGIAGWYGFDAAATTHNEHSIFGLQLAISWLPPVLVAFSLIFIALTPIDAKRHAIIRQRLDARAARSQVRI